MATTIIIICTYARTYTRDIPIVQIRSFSYSPWENVTRLNFEQLLLYENISRSKIYQTTVLYTQTVCMRCRWSLPHTHQCLHISPSTSQPHLTFLSFSLPPSLPQMNPPSSRSSTPSHSGQTRSASNSTAASWRHSWPRWTMPS